MATVGAAGFQNFFPTLTSTLGYKYGINPKSDTSPR